MKAWRRERRGLIICIVGVLLICFIGLVAPFWLVWDLLNTIVRYLDWEIFVQEFSFPAPFFIYRWTAHEWTGAYDIALLIAGVGFSVGIYLVIKGAYTVGSVKA